MIDGCRSAPSLMDALALVDRGEKGVRVCATAQRVSPVWAPPAAGRIVVSLGVSRTCPGCASVDAVRAERPSSPVIAMTVAPRSKGAVAAVRAGAVGLPRVPPFSGRAHRRRSGVPYIGRRTRGRPSHVVGALRLQAGPDAQPPRMTRGVRRHARRRPDRRDRADPRRGRRRHGASSRAASTSGEQRRDRTSNSSGVNCGGP